MRILIGISLLLLTTAIKAEGFGWYGQAINYTAAKSYVLGSGIGANYPELENGTLQNCLQPWYPRAWIIKALSHFSNVQSDPKSSDFERLEMLSAIVRVCTDFASVFEPSQEEGRFDSLLFEYASDVAPRDTRKVFEHFQLFGRAVGAEKSYEYCPYEVSWRRSTTAQHNCSPLHLILSPLEVKKLCRGFDSMNLQNEQYPHQEARELSQFVCNAAKANAGMYWTAFD